jgi:hypothetical protein
MAGKPNIDPTKIQIAIPGGRGYDGLCVLGMIALYRLGYVVVDPLMIGGTPVSIPRMLLVSEFLRGPCEWLLFIDDDIGFRPEDFCYLFEDINGELAVCAEYLKKTADRRYAVSYGLGFARIHRSVFETLKLLAHPDGSPACAPGDIFGCPVNDFFPMGFVPTGKYIAEDHGFWALCHQANIKVRIEKRTHLAHTGQYRWIYDQFSVEPEAQGFQVKRGLQHMPLGGNGLPPGIDPSQVKVTPLDAD